MSARTAALLLLPVAWVLGTPVAVEGAPRLDAGHESVWPSPPAVDEHAGHEPVPATEDHSEHGADHVEPAEEPDRPTGLVLGVFAGVNGAVLLSAAVLRRREREARRRRQQERSRRRAVPAGGAS